MKVYAKHATPRGIMRTILVEYHYMLLHTNYLDSRPFLCLPYIIVREYDQEILQSQTADKAVAPSGRAAQPSRDTR